MITDVQFQSMSKAVGQAAAIKAALLKVFHKSAKVKLQKQEKGI